MTKNLFTGLMSESFKQLHTDMITETIRGFSVTCMLSFGDTKYTDCDNCLYDSIGNKSSNRYQTGGPAPFTMGKCPSCFGLGKIPDEQSETILLPVITQQQGWYPISSSVQSPLGMVQTISTIATYNSLRRAKDLITHADLSAITIQRYERETEPEICSFGNQEFVLTMWKRIENG